MTAPTASPTRGRRWASLAVAVAVGAGLALLTFGSLRGDEPRMVGDPGSEHMSGAWVHTWAQNVLWEQHTLPLWIDGVGRGGRAVLYPLSVLTPLVALPLKPLLGTAAAYNGAMVLNFALAFGFGLALFRRLTGGRTALALPATVGFALSPFLLSHYNAGPPEGTTVGWLALALWAAVAWPWGGRRPWLRAVGKGAAVALTFAANPYYGVFALCAVLWLAVSEPGRSWAQRGLDAALTAAAAALPIAPMAWLIRYSMVHPAAMTPDKAPGATSLMVNEGCPHALAYLWPLEQYATPAVYVGLPLWIGALVAAARVPAARRWLALGALAGLFALGGTLRVGGWEPQLAGHSIPLPARWLCAWVPPFTSIAHPFRALPLVTLALGAAVTLALAGIDRPRRAALLAAGFAAAILVDSCLLAPVRPPVRSMPFYVPEACAWLREQPGEFAVFDAPLGGHDATVGRYLLYQQVHRRRIPYDINGRVPDLEADPDAFALAMALDLGRSLFPGADARRAPFRCRATCAGADALGALGYRYVVVHTHLIDDAIDAELRRCLAPCAAGVAYEDDDVWMVRVDGAGGAPRGSGG